MYNGQFFNSLSSSYEEKSFQSFRKELEALEQDIDARNKKLSEALSFLELRKREYKSLIELKSSAPTNELDVRLAELKVDIDYIENILDKERPRERIQQLTTTLNRGKQVLEDSIKDITPFPSW